MTETGCSSCLWWVLARRTLYEDGSVIDNWRPEPGKGGCKALGIETPPDFSCAKHETAPGDFTHFEDTHKSGAPWQHSHAGPCPDCSGKGNSGEGACHRCAGTSKVRYYDDGYIGEEQTRLHPKERESAANRLTCSGCARQVEPEWKVCPSCGVKLDGMGTLEKIADTLGLATG